MRDRRVVRLRTADVVLERLTDALLWSAARAQLPSGWRWAVPGWAGP